MSEPDTGTGFEAVFEAERGRLLGFAYRMLGSVADAEDAVQDAWLRWARADQATIANPAAWLTTVVGRLALDRLSAAEVRRTTYVGPWLPEPVASAPGPDEQAELSESLTFAFLVLLDRLSPVERAVLLLADVFHVPFSEVAVAVGKSDAACRQIAHRARAKVRQEGGPPAPADQALLTTLVARLARGDMADVVALLHPDVVLMSDGGPDRHAARRAVVGPERVGRLLVNLAKRVGAPDMSIRTINAAPAVVLAFGPERIVLQADERDGRLLAVRILLNPEKTTHVDEVVRLR